MSIPATVVDREREYHNQRFAEEVRTDQARADQDKYYFALKHADEKYIQLITHYSRNAVALEYGCGLAEWALRIAPGSREMHGIDISDVAIEAAKRQAAQSGLHNVHLAARDAHATDYPDDHFDLVFGLGIIHHLDTRRALEEVARILKPGGVAIFREPLGYNPLINLYRSATPEARTVDEHPLTKADFRVADKIFSKNEWEFYGLATLAAVPFRRTPLGEPMFKACAALDRALLSERAMGWQAWSALMKLTK